MTKFLFTVLLAVFAFPVARADIKQSDDWGAIVDQGLAVYIEQPKGAHVFGVAGFFNVCIEGNNFRTIERQATCIEEKVVFAGGGQEGPAPVTACVNKSYDYVYLPMAYTEFVCENYVYTSKGQQDGGGDATCTSGRNILTQLTNVLTFKVYKTKIKKDGDTDLKFLFKKDYTVPNCP